MNLNETDPSTQAPVPPPAEETIRKVYVKDLKEKERVHTVFRVAKKARVTARSGKNFLALALSDKTGILEARVFEQVDEADGAFQEGDYLLVEGSVISFHGKAQLVVEKLQRLEPDPMDPAEFTPPAAPLSPEPSTSTPGPKPSGHHEESGRAAAAQIRELVEHVSDEHVRSLLLAFLDDPVIVRGLPIAPAAKGIHHAYRGGLAEHILSVMRLAHRMADHYPMVDRDLLVAGALLHDIDKVSEISPEPGFEYTDEGRLVGHIVMTAQKIHAKASAIPGFPKALEQHITHLVLAHHGQLEYGSPKLPMTLEAHIVHAIDSLDSRIASWLELMAKDPHDRWTESSKLYERHLWKGRAPTAQGKSPVEGRSGERTGGGGRRRRRGSGGGGGGGGGGPHPGNKPKEKEALGLSFKPLDALAPASEPKKA